MAQRIDRAASFGQNLYVDTRGAAGEPVSFTQAVINGLAQGGGLYVPEELPTLSLDEICALARLPYAQRAAAIYKAFNVDLPDDAIDELMGRAYGDNFDDEAICPITSLDESTHILELWHGPTSAFKDMALQCLPHFFSASAEKLREEGTLDHEFMILVATSGDTGKAALEGFKGVDGVSIGVLFPDGGVSDIQRKQMVTTTGDNVQVWAVRGNFDDCQTGVKHAFADEKFAEKLLDEYRIALSSANSINWGRLLPQVVYYISSYAELVAAGKIEAGCPIDVCVPTGNFGNILAGWMAKEMGLPVSRFVCASNANNVLTDFIETGVYDRRRPFHVTTSPSMDILVSSNLERYLYLESGRDAALVARLMRELQTDVSLRVEETDSADSFRVSGRGELHLSVLIENMRRQGYEFQVSKPEVLFHYDENGNKLEPMEKMVADVPSEYAGAVIEKIGRRRGVLDNMTGTDRVRLEFTVPSRGLFGYRSEFMTDTRGEGVMSAVFDHYEPYKGDIPHRNVGALVSTETGDAVMYGLFYAQDRGTLFCGPNTAVYTGMIVGQNARQGDIDVNVCRQKHLTSIRNAAGAETAMKLTSMRTLTLEECLEFIDDDELLEITPKSLRMRKRVLETELRKKLAAKKRAEANS